ncbi:MAG: hypothetical protein M1839_007995 [Geoglossum umbratile]|nr:MAG: hypothetical protein M1839_007995 [Geoglossum umbratile]
MKIAEVLSDLKSLHVCGPDEALALVKTAVGPSEIQSSSDTPKTGSGDSIKPTDENDPDIKRAQGLLALHPTFKAQHGQTFNSDLESARRDIGALIGRFKGAEGAGRSSSTPAQ